MRTVKYVQTRDPDTGILSEPHLLEVTAENVIFTAENLTLPQKMEQKAEKEIYGDKEISKGRVYQSTKGEGSLAFGEEVQALGKNSSALGISTIASSSESLSLGRYNIKDEEERFAFIIGNGKINEQTEVPIRSNAFAIDWEGNVYAKKFVNLEGEEALTTLKTIQVGDNHYELHGTNLHLVAGHNIELAPSEILTENEDGTTAHTLQVVITAGEGIPGDGSETGVGDGKYLPLIGGTEYGPVVFNTVYNREKFTNAEKIEFLKLTNRYKEGMTQDEINDAVQKTTYTPISIGDPERIQLNLDMDAIFGPTIDAYNKLTQQGADLFINKNKGNVIIGNSKTAGIIFIPKKRSGGSGISINSTGSGALGWGSNVSPIGQNSIAFGTGTRAGGTSSVAEGDVTKASGVASHAEGARTYAGGTTSHAEGTYTCAKGAYSHSEGYGVNVLGIGSHGEGYGDAASIIQNLFSSKNTKEEIELYWNSTTKFSLIFGDYSHSEGYNNLVLGNYSHAEGVENEIFDDYNHLEGASHYTNGQYNHLEGFGHSNEGYYNHITGYMHHLTGKYSFISGMQNLINGNKNFVHGKRISINANKVIALGEKIYVDDYNRIINQRFIVGNNINLGNNTKYDIAAEDFGSFILGSNLSLSLNANTNATNFFFGKKNTIKTQSNYADNILISIGNSILNGKDKNISNDYIIGMNNSYKEIESFNDLIYSTDTNFINIKSSNSILLLKSSQIQSNTENKFALLNNNILIGSNQFYIDSLSNVGIFGNNNILKLNKMFSNIIIGERINFDKALKTSSTIYSENTLFYGYNIEISGDSYLLNNNIQGFNLQLLSANLKNTFITSTDSIFDNCTLKNIYIEGIEHNFENYICEEEIEGCAHIEGYRNSLGTYYGLGTHIEGAYNKAEIGSHVEGCENIIAGYFSHAEGNHNNITGRYNHAEGQNNYILSLAENQSLCIHSEGNNCNILGQYSHIEGAAIDNYADELLLLLEEEDWIINIQQLQRENPKYHFSFGNYNHNEGLCNLVLSANSHTEGINNINSMNNSHIEGENNYNVNKENYSIGGHTEGYKNINIGKYSHIEGIGKIIDIFNEDVTYELWQDKFFNYTDGEGNHVEGIENFGHGKASHVEGYHNAALGDYSHASGSLSIAKGKNSYAMGIGTIAEYDNQYAIGKYNKSVEDAIIMIGNGKSEEERKNIVKISKDGIVTANGFELSNGQPIGGDAGSELPIGTVITNRNPDSSGIDYGIWENLGSQEVVLSKGTYTLYYWERTKGWIEPSEDEIYSIIGREVPSSEKFIIDGNETSELEIYSIKKEVKG